MSLHQPPRVPESSQTNKGWEKRIPLTYGSRYQHLSHLPKYSEFCTIVETNRRAAANRTYSTLVQRSAKIVAQNLRSLSPGAISSLPDHLLTLVVSEIMVDPRVLMWLKDDVWDAFPLSALQEMWDKLYESQHLPLHLWRALSPRLLSSSKTGKSLPLHHFSQHLTPCETSQTWDFRIYTSPLISPSYSFITALSIGFGLQMMDYISLSGIVNLGSLEISDRLGYLPEPEGEERTARIDIDVDRLFRAWAARAEEGAFRCLRVLRVDFRESGLTTDIFPHLNKFPVLGIIYPGPKKWKMDKRGKYVSDHDSQSIELLLPQGWKGVTIRGPVNRDIHESARSMAAMDKGKEVSNNELDGTMKGERFRPEKMGDDITTTRSDGRLKDSHCLHEVLHSSLMRRLPSNLRSLLAPSTTRCPTPKSPALWHGNFLVNLPSTITTHEDLGEALEKFATEPAEDDELHTYTHAKATDGGGGETLKDVEWRLYVQDVGGRQRGLEMNTDLEFEYEGERGEESEEGGCDEDSEEEVQHVEDMFGEYYGPKARAGGSELETYGARSRRGGAGDGEERNYHIATEKAMVLEFSTLGMIRLDRDLEAAGIHAGPALLCEEENGKGILGVESKVPIVSLRIGESVVGAREGEMVLVREELLSGEENRGVGKRKEEKKKMPVEVEEELARRREEIARHEARRAKKKEEDKAKGFDKNFWEMIGMPPP